KAVQIVLKSMGHSVDENKGRQNQALRRKQQLTFLRLAPFLWKSHFIGVYAAANAPQQAKQAFTSADYFKMYNDAQTRKQSLTELTELYDQIKEQITRANAAIESGEEFGFVLNFITQQLSYETAIRIISHSKPAMKKDEEEEEEEQDELVATQQSLIQGEIEKQNERF
ncbi:MAG: hypothetical protein EZS28_037786, partial [Streblomastix strix]